MRNERQTIYFQAGEAILAQTPLSMVLTDPNRDDNPIVYVNSAFEQLTGYAASYAVGRNCRFLQGEDTDQPGVIELAQAVEAREPVTVRLRNYRADGTKFDNLLRISPVLDAAGEIEAFLGIQTSVGEAHPGPDARIEVIDERLEEMQHRVKNHLQMISSLVRIQSREVDAAQSFKLLARRIDSLALLYDEFSSPPDPAESVRYDVVSAGGYVSRVASTVGALDGRKQIRIGIDTDTVYMRSERAAHLGLLTSEILSNTVQHAFDGRKEGLATVTLKQGGGDRVRLTVSDDGVGMIGDWPVEGNLGARIVRNLVTQLDGDLNVITNASGTIITVDFDNAIDTSLEGDGTRILTDTDGRRSGLEDGGPRPLPSE